MVELFDNELDQNHTSISFETVYAQGPIRGRYPRKRVFEPKLAIKMTIRPETAPAMISLSRKLNI